MINNNILIVEIAEKETDHIKKIMEQFQIKLNFNILDNISNLNLALEQLNPAIVIFNYLLPSSGFFAIIDSINFLYKNTKIVVISDQIDDYLSESYSTGHISDFVIRNDLNSIANKFKKIINENIPFQDRRPTQVSSEEFSKINKNLLTVSGEYLHNKSELRKYQIKYGELIQSARSIILQWDKNRSITFCNKFALDFFGYKESELIGSSFAVLFQHVEELDSIINRIQLTGNNDRIDNDNFEFKNRKKNGELVWISYVNKPYYDRNGKLIEVISIGNDITRLKHIETMLRQREYNLRTICENTPDLIIRFNKDFRLIYANKAWESISGINRNSNIRMHRFKSMLPDSLKTTLIETLEKVKFQKSEVYTEFKFPHGTETNFFQVVAIPEFNSVNELRSILAIAHDITERVKFENILQTKTIEMEAINQELNKKNIALDNANNRLKEMDMTKSEFVSMASHELRTPLTGIIGLTQTLLSKDIEITEEEKEHYLKIIEGEGKRLSNLLNELLDITRIETGVIEMHHENVNVNNLVAETLQILPLPSSININVLATKENIEVWADKDRLKQVITNLIDNAIRYSNAEGTISIRLNEQDHHIAIGIQDTGPGIAKDELPKIFTKFYRARSARVSKTKGSGLGLTIAKSIIELHGGRIWVESEVGKGSVFSFTIKKRDALNEESVNH